MQLYGLENTKEFELAFHALIPAAGTGSRLRAELPKQYLMLAGKPMLWHAVKSLCVPPVETVFVVLAPEDRGPTISLSRPGANRPSRPSIPSRSHPGGGEDSIGMPIGTNYTSLV